MRVDDFIYIVLGQRSFRPSLVQRRTVDNGVFTGTIARGCSAVNGNDGSTEFRRLSGSGNTRNADTNDNNIRSNLIINVRVVNLRFLSQPVIAGCTGSLLIITGGSGSASLCLFDAVCSGGHNSF